MPEAMKTVRNELGNDAVILNSRIVFTGGFLGFFRKKNIEVIAAIDPNTTTNINPVFKDKSKIPLPQSKKPIQEEAQNNADHHISKDQFTETKQTDDIMKELIALKELINTQSFQSTPVQASYPKPIQQVQNWMGEQEFSVSLQNRFLAALMEKWYEAGLKSSNKEMISLLNEEITKFLSNKPFGGISFTKKYVNVIGPTGVGKTTTLAKIAADCLLNHKKKVAFITTDTYRIGAIEQLKTYAQILNIPIEVCYSLDDFQTATNKFASFDVILIDTAGRNFRNKQYVEDLQKIIDFDMELETYLVLALTAKQKDMEEIIQQFSSISVNKFIFTKADETSVYGSMINLVEKYNIGVSYVTNGQSVPDDLMIASPNTITNILLGAK